QAGRRQVCGCRGACWAGAGHDRVATQRRLHVVGSSANAVPPHGRVGGYGRETDGFAVSHLEKRRSRGVTFLATPSVGDCPRCFWGDHEWTSLSGRGTIRSSSSTARSIPPCSPARRTTWPSSSWRKGSGYTPTSSPVVQYPSPGL